MGAEVEVTAFVLGRPCPRTIRFRMIYGRAALA